MQKDRNDRSHSARAWLEEDPTPHQKVHQLSQLSSRQFSAVLKSWSESLSWIFFPPPSSSSSHRHLGNSGDSHRRRRRHVREQRQGGVQHPGGAAVLLRGPWNRSVISNVWNPHKYPRLLTHFACTPTSLTAAEAPSVNAATTLQLVPWNQPVSRSFSNTLFKKPARDRIHENWIFGGFSQTSPRQENLHF